MPGWIKHNVQGFKSCCAISIVGVSSDRLSSFLYFKEKISLGEVIQLVIYFTWWHGFRSRSCSRQFTHPLRDMSLNPATGKFEDLVFDTKTGKLMAVKNKAPVNPDSRVYVEMDAAGFFTKEAWMCLVDYNCHWKQCLIDYLSIYVIWCHVLSWKEINDYIVLVNAFVLNKFQLN